MTKNKSYITPIIDYSTRKVFLKQEIDDLATKIYHPPTRMALSVGSACVFWDLKERLFQGSIRVPTITARVVRPMAGVVLYETHDVKAEVIS